MKKLLFVLLLLILVGIGAYLAPLLFAGAPSPPLPTGPIAKETSK